MAELPENLPKSRPMGDLGIRALSAAVFAPAFVFLAWRGEHWFVALISLMAAACTYEFIGLLRHSGRHPFRAVAYLGSLSLPWMLYFDGPAYLWPFWMCVFLATLLGAVARGRTENVLQDIGTTLLGVLYVGGLLGHLVLLRELPEQRGGTHLQGFFLVVFAFASMWVSDTGAYLVGSLFGRHKIAPRISPGKSWEGAFGAAVLTAAAGYLCGATLLGDLLTPWMGAWLGLLASIVGLFGDLVESMFKRDAGIKDTSNIIPGHGGVLDRFDSVLFVGPLIYWAMYGFIL